MKLIVFQRLFSTFLFLLLISLVGCGGAKPVLLSQSDIATAETEGTLFELYQDLETKKLQAGRSELKQLVVLQASVADKLVQLTRKTINKNVLKNRNSDGLVDLLTLANLSSEIKKLEAIKPEVYQQLNKQLQILVAETAQEIQILKDNWQGKPSASIDGLENLLQIAKLAGKASTESELYSKTRLSFIQSTAEQARLAYAKRMFNTSLELSQKGLKIDPGNLQFESMMTQSQMQLFEQGFRSAMEHAKPEKAYQSLMLVAEKPIIELIKHRMENSINLLTQYFANSARFAYQKDKLYDAYKAFKKGRQVQKILDRGVIGFPQERLFLDKVMLKTQSVEDNLGIKYGLLILVHQFDPKYPNLNLQLEQIKQQLAKRATTKLNISDFKEVASSNSVIASVGRRVSKQLENMIFNKMGQQVIILSQHLDTSQNDLVVSELHGLEFSIQGDVLQAAIETTIHQGQRSKNVLTGIEKVETQEYKKWSKRKKGDAPQQYNERKTMQEIFLKVEHIKKLAVLEISYRIVEPSSHKVILTQELLKEDSFKGETIAEMQKGLFKQPFKEAELPSDIKIMDQLARQISEQLGDALMQYLSNPERIFFEKYENNMKLNKKALAANFLANAMVLADQPETSEWKQQLIKLSIQN